MESDARNHAFRTLKPTCVALSQSALGVMGGRGSVAEVIKGLERLLQILKTPAVSAALDEKLADYVFFPISHVLRQMEKLPLRAQELTLECIFILLQTAWKTAMAPDLGIQLLILLSFLADSTDKKKSATSEELQSLAFSSIALVFGALGHDQEGKTALVATASVPHIGKCLSVILNGVLEGTTAAVQLAALDALQSFCAIWPDRVALSTSFFPGIISCLTKVLSPKPSQKRPFNVLSTALQNLGQLLATVLGDAHTKALPEGSPSKDAKPRLDKTWLTATTGQVKLALANIIKLRNHDRRSVRQAVGKFCMQCLQDCWESLSESRSMLLETMAALSSDDGVVEKDLKYLSVLHEAVPDILRSSLYHWIIALPRTMLSTDDVAQRRLLGQVSMTYKMLREEGVDLSMLENNIAASLRDSVINAIASPKKSSGIAEYQGLASDMELTGLTRSVSKTFDDVLGGRGSQKETIKDITRLVLQISDNDSSLQIAKELISNLQNSQGDLQVASFWLSLNILRNVCESSLSPTDYFEADFGTDNSREDLLEQLYSFSLNIIASGSHDQGMDWRLQALGLEAIALQATQQKQDFQPELVDALYPVVHLIGSPNPSVRSHAITCVNILAEQCGYKDSGDLILSNVDYLVNAVGIRLNTFDLSPQAPLVLMMMVKLAGPSLLPYLDDLVDSIFAALESFHGYPKLVELLFSVLKTIVEEGINNHQLAIKDSANSVYNRAHVQPIPMSDLVRIVQSGRKRRAIRAKEDLRTVRVEAEGEGQFPREPWAGVTKYEGKEIIEPESGSTDEDENNPTKEFHDADQPGKGDDHEPGPPVPKTYALILNITQLTQHYLTSSSVELRISLLSLIKATAPALAKHKNSFLPLINTLWPVLLPRLQDQEAYVVAGTLDAISSLCANAGDFMRSRIEEAWQGLGIVHARCRNGGGRAYPDPSKGNPMSLIKGMVALPARSRMPSGLALYHIDSPSRIIWQSLVELLKSVVIHVAINGDMFDDIVDMLLPVIGMRPDIRDALDSRNADAVWLALRRLKSAKQDISEKNHEKLASIMAKPVGKQHWRFAEVLG